MPENTAQTATASHPSEMFWFERRDCDLPFYRGAPVGVSPLGWGLVLIAVAIAFYVLMRTQPIFGSGFGTFIPPLLFVLIPLGTLALVAGGSAPLALFRPLRGRDAGIIVGFFVLNAIATILLGLLVTNLFHTVANPAGDIAASVTGMDQVLFFGWTAIQLLGEEVFTILPFLAFLAFLDRFLQRKAAIALAALGAAVIFALIHLPTYQWNVPQALIGLVPIRIILLLPFLITRNIWASTGTHILNDWAIFSLSMVGAGAE